MTTTLLDDLKRDIAEGHVTVVVGAGVTMAATRDPDRKPDVASWIGLLESGTEECVKVAQPLPDGWEARVRGEIASGDLEELLFAAEKISRRLGAPDGGAYGKWLRETVGSLKVRSRDVPAALGDLGLPLLTTNYDSVLEEVTRRPPLTWRDEGLVERVIRGEDTSIVHLHGHWMRPDTVILGIRSYEDVLRAAHTQAMLRALRATKSLLFVGVGGTLQDPNLGELLRWSREALKSSHYQHYRLEREQDVEERQKLHPREERLFVVPYGREFADLAPFLRSLVPPRKAASVPAAPAVIAAELPDVPAELIAACAEGHLIVLVGADASLGSGMPSRDAMLADLLQLAVEAASDPSHRRDLTAMKAEWSAWDPRERALVVRRALGDTRLREAVAERFRSSGTPGALHRAVAGLHGASFITTNYDRLLEAALEARSGRRPKALLPGDPDGVKAFGPGQVLKLHGDAEEPESLVLRDEVSSRLAVTLSAAWKERLASFFKPPYKVLLVGFGSDDANVLELLDELRRASGEPLDGLFWLATKGPREERRAQAAALRPIWLSDVGQAPRWLERFAESSARHRREASVMQMARTMAEDVLEGFTRDNAEASKRFDAHDYEEARRAYQAMAERASTNAASATADDETRSKFERWAARCRLNVAACVLCLQQPDEARTMFRDLGRDAAALLSPGQRATLSQGLAMLGETRMARDVMPTPDEATKDEEREHIAVVAQLLDVLDGRLPERLLDHPFLHLHAARYHLEHGDLEEAALLASCVLDGPEDPILQASAVFVLARCLIDTVWERAGVARPLPRPRDEVVRRIDESFERISTMKLPEAVARDAARLRALYDVQTENTERHEQAYAVLKKEGPAMFKATPLPEDAAPWLANYAHASTVLAEKGYKQAVDEAVVLTQRWPGRAPLEYFAARVLAEVARAEEALEHAQRGFAELPGRGYRLLLGRCLLMCGRAEDAWERLQALVDSTYPPILRLRALVAQQIPTRATDARDLWEQYLATGTEEAWPRLQLALTLFRLGERHQAAEEAWRAATEPGSERLDASSLYACADLQRFDEESGEEGRTRVLKIVEILRERFRGDVGAERLRLRLLMALGFPEDAAAPPWQQLIDAGALRALTTEQVVTRFQQQMQRHEGARALYRAGKLSFEGLCALTSTEAAAHVHQFLLESQETPGSMSPPAAVGEPPPDLRGSHVLASELELLLLQKLGLLRALRSALGQDGRLLLFQDVWNRILSGVYLHAGVDTPAEGDAQLAMDLQKALGAGIDEGWVILIERPGVPDFPPLQKLEYPDEVRSRLEEQRRHLEQALTWLEALVGHPERRLLSADFYVTARLGTHAEVTLALAWSGPTFEAFGKRLEDAYERVRHLPQIVRHIVFSPERRRRIMIQLAQLGFTEALEATDLLALAQRPGGLEDVATAKALDGMERVPRDAAHDGAMVAQVALANIHAQSVWGAFCSETLSSPEKETIAGHLLRRAEAVAETAAADTLDLTLQFVAGCIMNEPLRSCEPSDEEGKVFLSDKSTAGQLWTYLDGWAGPRGSRRAAYDRALCETWRLADVFTAPRGPKRAEIGLLLLADRRLANASLLNQEVLTPAILSAQWEHKPLSDMEVNLTTSGGKDIAIDFEQLLIAGAKIVESQPKRTTINEALLTYPFHRADMEHDIRVGAPPEAVLLRLSHKKVPDAARQLAYLQGMHDGRAYHLLTALAEAPTDVDLRRRYAQMTVVAPWRLVREDPTVLCTWRPRPADGRTFPNSLEDLREMLSEPPSALPESGSMRDVLTERFSDKGFWEQRLDQGPLIGIACEIPGAMAAVAASARLKDTNEYSRNVSLALYRLDTPNDWPMGQLCTDIFFLRLAAASRPIVKVPIRRDQRAAPGQRNKFVPSSKKKGKKGKLGPSKRSSAEVSAGVRQIDLREELPARLANALDAIITPPPDSLAYVEPAILRLCGQVVQRLNPVAPIRLKDGLWLAHRLFRWLWAQLERLPDDARRAGVSALARVAPPPQPIFVEDLLHPLNVDRDRYDLRLAAVLLGLAFMEDVAATAPGEGAEPQKASAGSPRPQSVSSAALERILLDLAARPLSDEERRIRRLGAEPSCLDWHGPGAIPDLALTALLKLNEERFMDLPLEARLRWIEALPREQGDKNGVGEQLEQRIAVTCARHAGRLTQGERVALEDYGRRRGGPMRWFLLTSLFVAGQPHLALEARNELLAHLDSEAAPSGFGGYIAALAVQAPDRIEAEVQQLLAEVRARGLDPVPFAVGLGSAIFRSDRSAVPAVRDVLRSLASQPPYQNDERMTRLMQTLGLSGRAARRSRR